VAFINARNSENCSVIRADLMHTPFKDELFDLIIADGCRIICPIPKLPYAHSTANYDRVANFS
jgi:hypothetical protein